MEQYNQSKIKSAFFFTLAQLFIKAMPLWGAEGVVDKIDKGLHKYYTHFQIEAYLDEDGTGKFSLFCTENGIDDEVVREELEVDKDDCLLLELDDDFPYPENLETDEQKKDFLFDLIKFCAEDGSDVATILLPASELTTIFKSDFATILKKGWKALGMSLTIGDAIFTPKELAEASKEVERIEKLTNLFRDSGQGKKLSFRFSSVWIDEKELENCLVRKEKSMALITGYIRMAFSGHLVNDIQHLILIFLLGEVTLPLLSERDTILKLEEASLTNYAWLLDEHGKCLGPVLFTQKESGTAYIWEKLKKFSACYVPTFSKEEMLQPLSIVELHAASSSHKISSLTMYPPSATFNDLYVKGVKFEEKENQPELRPGLREWYGSNISQLLKRYPLLHNYVRLQQLIHSILVEHDFNPEYVSTSRRKGLRYLDLRYKCFIDHFCALKDNPFDKATFKMIFRQIWDRYRDAEHAKGDLAESFEEEYAKFLWSDSPEKSYRALVSASMHYSC
ncbi:MAG: hypothetical protein AAF335_02855 [Bacteroidota bacterium]